jgi:RNA polymerase sigma-70 factor, ECF subfamily
MRAWNRRGSYEGRAGVRAWLYRIATNACIDAIRARATRGGGNRDEDVSPYASVPWLQPYPDVLLEAVSQDTRPDARLVSRDTIELAFLATIQGLPPKQRAVLILRDVLDFSAIETAEILENTVAAVNAALQRARATVQRRRGTLALSASAVAPSFDEAVLLETFMDAQDRGDLDTMIDMLREDVRMTLFPDGITWSGLDAVARELRAKRGELDGDVRSVPIAANRQPALGVYFRWSTEPVYRAWAIVVLGMRDGKLREIATFASPELFARFGLPPTLEGTAA